MTSSSSLSSMAATSHHNSPTTPTLSGTTCDIELDFERELNIDIDLDLSFRMEKSVSRPKRESVVEEKAAVEQSSKPSMRSLFRILSYGTPLDYTLQVIGALAAIGAGTALPFMTLVFGQLVNVFNTVGPNGPADPQFFRQAIASNTLWFVYLFLGKFVLVYIHTLCFTLTGTRILRTIRLKYLSSFLRQDISYYDSRSTGSITSRITVNATKIHVGISDKLGSAIQAIAMFFTTFILAFVVQWKLTLVSAVTFPGMMLAMGFTVSLDSKIEAKLLSIYSRCGTVAEEVLGSIRTVIALGAGEKLCAKYDLLLAEAMAQGIKKGPVIGIQFSIQWFAMYCGYSLSFWYGIRLYSSGEIQNPGIIITQVLKIP
jgi:ATP-binding cassette, subfamily B (MDR/TAP), member 1